MRALDEFTSELPYAFREQVTGYARSVRDAADEICRDAGIAPSAAIRDQLLWLAAIRKLHALISSAFWTVDSSNRLLRQQAAGSPLVGATDYSNDSVMYSTLAALNRDIEALVGQLEIANLIRLPWSEVVQIIANENRLS